MFAAQNKADGVAKLLVEAKADVDVETVYGYTALMIAANNASDGVAKLLIDAGAALDAKDKVRSVGRCPCMYT